MEGNCEATHGSSDGRGPSRGEVLEEDYSSHYGSSVFEAFDPDEFDESLPIIKSWYPAKKHIMASFDWRLHYMESFVKSLRKILS